MQTSENRCKEDFESFLLSPGGGYTMGADTYDAELGVYADTLIDFIQRTQPNTWECFVNGYRAKAKRKFCLSFNKACNEEGLLSVLRHGFQHRRLHFRVCYFKPESALHQTSVELWAHNKVECYRQWNYSADRKKSGDMGLTLNGIPVFAFEFKHQSIGQAVDNVNRQWMYDHGPDEVCYKRVLAYFCVDNAEVWMTTKREGLNTDFIPFYQDSNGAGSCGKMVNPATPDGYPTYRWETVFQKDRMMEGIQKFMSLQGGETLIFPQ